MADLNTLRHLWREVPIRHNKWQNHVDTFGLAYEDAYEQHKKILADQKKDTELKFEIAYTVIGLVTWGSTKWLGQVAESTYSTEFKDWVFEPVVEVIKIPGSATGKHFQTQATSHYAPAVSKSPFRYHTELTKALRTHVIAAQEFLQREITAVERNPSLEKQADNHYIVQEVMTKPFFKVPPPYDRSTVALEMEKGMWALWASKLKGSITAMGNPGEPSMTVATYSKPGGTVEGHLNKIGVKIGGKPLDFGIWTDQNEIRKLISWGSTFEPTKFGTEL